MGNHKRALSTQKKIGDEVSVLKDDLEETSDIYFELTKEKITFLHLELDLSLMDKFNIFWDGHLVDIFDISQLSNPIASPFRIFKLSLWAIRRWMMT